MTQRKEQYFVISYRDNGYYEDDLDCYTWESDLQFKGAAGPFEKAEAQAWADKGNRVDKEWHYKIVPKLKLNLLARL